MRSRTASGAQWLAYRWRLPEGNTSAHTLAMAIRLGKRHPSPPHMPSLILQQGIPHASTPVQTMRCSHSQRGRHEARSSDVHWGRRVALRGITEMR
jgi:hypothetical protein